MFDIRIQYTCKGKTPGNFIVNPDHIRECSGESIAEALSKFVLEVARLQQDLHDEELAELRGVDDDIPF
jgi:hypothetical protein